MELSKLWLGICPLKNSDKINLLDIFNSSEELLDHLLKHPRSLSIEEKIKCKLLEAWNKDELLRTLEYLQKINARFITCEDKEYNTNLNNIGKDKPYILFYKGDLAPLEKLTAAVVGSRNCTAYGREICASIVQELTSLGINIISGGAMGIDALAHEKALGNNNFTAAVLGCGIDVIYPEINRNLLDTIASRGALISEFLPGTKPFGFNFPVRNRIISGIADIIIIIEASLKSGSCITGRRGADQGREVIAVPGALTMKNSQGCNKLIEEGAHIYLGIESIYNALDFNHKWTEQKKASPILVKNSKIEDVILKIISDKPTHIDEIQKSSNIDISVLYGLLFEMQLKNQIISLSGNFYARII